MMLLPVSCMWVRVSLVACRLSVCVRNFLFSISLISRGCCFFLLTATIASLLLRPDITIYARPSCFFRFRRRYFGTGFLAYPSSCRGDSTRSRCRPFAGAHRHRNRYAWVPRTYQRVACLLPHAPVVSLSNMTRTAASACGNFIGGIMGCDVAPSSDGVGASPTPVAHGGEIGVASRGETRKMNADDRNPHEMCVRFFFKMAPLPWPERTFFPPCPHACLPVCLPVFNIVSRGERKGRWWKRRQSVPRLGY